MLSIESNPKLKDTPNVKEVVFKPEHSPKQKSDSIKPFEKDELKAESKASKKIDRAPKMNKNFSNADDEDAVLLTEEDPIEEEKQFTLNKRGETEHKRHVKLGKVDSMADAFDDDSCSSDLSNEEHFNYKVPKKDENEMDKSITGLKEAILQKCEQIFVKMKTENKSNKQRIKRPPIWMWEDDKDNPDVLDSSQLRILSVTWNMNAKKPPKDITQLIRPDIKHDIYAIGSEE